MLRRILFTVLALSAATAARSQTAAPPGRQAVFLARALSYDRNLAQRSDSRVHVLVLHIGAADSARAMVDAFNDAETELELEATASEFDRVAHLLELLDTGDFDAVYIEGSATPALSSILQATRSRKLPSLGGNRKMVENGASLGVYLREGAPHIIVNLRAAKIEGLGFSANLLNIATVIR